MNPLVLAPVLFIVVGAVFTVVGVRYRRAERAFRAVALRAPGVVTDVRYRLVRQRRGADGSGMAGVWFPVLRFGTADGRQVDTETRFGRSPAPARRGERVTVLYDPADPTRASIENRGSGSLFGLFFVLFGVVFVVLGLLVGGGIVFVTQRL